jgi:hypothetical protein
MEHWLTMQALSAQQILQIWDVGQRQHPIDRALMLLSAAMPDCSIDRLANLSIGQRDGYLLQLRQLTLGSQLESFAECPKCAEPLEFQLQIEDLLVDQSGAIEASSCCYVEEWEVQFRRLTSRDLATILGCSTVQAAQQQLVQQCVQTVHYQDQARSISEFPPALLVPLSEQLAAADPQAELLLDLTCPACRHDWQILFDIVTFFWAELNAQAKRLIGEVHTLARSYGWREADILAMSSMRRQLYLDRVSI